LGKFHNERLQGRLSTTNGSRVASQYILQKGNVCVHKCGSTVKEEKGRIDLMATETGQGYFAPSLIIPSAALCRLCNLLVLFSGPPKGLHILLQQTSGMMSLHIWLQYGNLAYRPYDRIFSPPQVDRKTCFYFIFQTDVMRNLFFAHLSVICASVSV
jgi:hypothetical protein